MNKVSHKGTLFKQIFGKVFDYYLKNGIFFKVMTIDLLNYIKTN